MLRRCLLSPLRCASSVAPCRSKTRFVFDLDNTLYPYDTGVMPRIGERVSEFVSMTTGLSPSLANLLRSYLFRREGLQRAPFHMKTSFLSYMEFCFSDWELSSFLSGPSESLTSLLHSLSDNDVDLWVFTNGIEDHAHRVLDYLDIADFFSDRIVTINSINRFDADGIVLPFDDDCPEEEGPCDAVTRLCCKPQAESFRRALSQMNFSDDDRVVFIDDELKNLIASKEFGWVTVLVQCVDDVGIKGEGEVFPPEIDFVVESVEDVAGLLDVILEVKEL